MTGRNRKRLETPSTSRPPKLFLMLTSALKKNIRYRTWSYKKKKKIANPIKAFKSHSCLRRRSE